MRRLLAAFALALALPAHAQRDSHVPACSELDGLRKARCDRHERMYEKRHAVRSEAHGEYDAGFLANPLECDALAAPLAELCAAEHDAVEACKGETGRAFVRCVSERLRADPRY